MRLTRAPTPPLGDDRLTPCARPVKSLALCHPPQVLCLHLKRFQARQDGSLCKLSAFVKFPLEGLDARPLMTQVGASALPGVVAMARNPTAPFPSLWRRRRRTRASPRPTTASLPLCATLASWRVRSYQCRGGEAKGGEDPPTPVLCAHPSAAPAPAAEGHYVAVVRHHVTGEWLLCDDERVSPVSRERVQQMYPYVLFYEHAGSKAREDGDMSAREATWRDTLRPGGAADPCLDVTPMPPAKRRTTGEGGAAEEAHGGAADELPAADSAVLPSDWVGRWRWLADPGPVDTGELVGADGALLLPQRNLTAEAARAWYDPVPAWFRDRALATHGSVGRQLRTWREVMQALVRARSGGWGEWWRAEGPAQLPAHAALGDCRTSARRVSTAANAFEPCCRLATAPWTPRPRPQWGRRGMWWARRGIGSW